jgi:hypothetical protein
MKRALRLVGCCVLIGTAFNAARGDDHPQKPAKVPPTIDPATGAVIAGSSDPMTTPAVLPPADAAVTTSPSSDTESSSSSAPNPNILDPEDVARQTLEIQQQNAEKAETAESDARAWQQQQQALEDHDWMLRGYEEQLRKKGLEKASDEDPDALSSPNQNGDSTDPADDPLLTPPASVAKDKAADGSVTGNDKSTSLFPSMLQPLLPPLASNTPSSNASISSDDTAEADPNSAASDTSPAIPTQPGDSSMLDIPGMTAAQEGMAPRDLNLDDRLPDEPTDTTKPPVDQNIFTPPTAPLSDADAFFKKQAASLQPLNAPTFRVLTTPPSVVNPYKEPKTTAKPVINGLRNHIADPFDILNRPAAGDE